MSNDVEFVIEDMLKLLCVEEETTFKVDKDNDCNKKKLYLSNTSENETLISFPEKEKNSTCKLNTSKLLNENENSINTDTSSGFGDSTTLKSAYNDSPTQTKFIENFQIQNEISDIKEPELHDFDKKRIEEASGIFTSTPKKFRSETKKNSLENSVNSEKNLFIEKYKEETECLNTTIEEAITKYQKDVEAKEMKHVFIQTSFEKSISKCKCKINKCLETNEFPTVIDAENLPLKKAKIETHCEKSDKLQEKDNEKVECQLLNTENKIIGTIVKSTILNHPFPINEKKEISAGEEKNNFCRIPRIRVGLSKRAKIKPQT